MNAGKTTTLLQSSHNYVERGMNTLLLKPRIDDRDGANVIRSRIGLEAESKLIDREDNLLEKIATEHNTSQLNCVLIDEAQFLSREQVASGIHRNKMHTDCTSKGNMCSLNSALSVYLHEGRPVRCALRMQQWLLCQPLHTADYSRAHKQI